jgi:hypothetical protein
MPSKAFHSGGSGALPMIHLGAKYYLALVCLNKNLQIEFESQYGKGVKIRKKDRLRAPASILTAVRCKNSGTRLYHPISICLLSSLSKVEEFVGLF